MKKGIYSCFFKRFFDITLSFLGIVILSPLFLLVIILSSIILRGNPFFTQYRQYRYGKNGKIFKLLKFRSMADKFDKDGNLLPDKDRMTKWGTFIRKTSIDELPQLFNILKGEMSFIGPRPRIIEECVFLRDDQKTRFLVRPGITGWAQVNGRNSITFDKVVEYDKEYVENLTFWMDIKIIFKTIKCLFKHDDINKQGTTSNEFHGDYLLRTGQVDKDYYDAKIAEAMKIIGEAQKKKD